MGIKNLMEEKEVLKKELSEVYNKISEVERKIKLEEMENRRNDFNFLNNIFHNYIYYDDGCDGVRECYNRNEYADSSIAYVDSDRVIKVFKDMSDTIRELRKEKKELIENCYNKGLESE